MFEGIEELCDKISDSSCVTSKELQRIEMALKMFDLYEEMIDQVLGLDMYNDEPLGFDFKLKYALERNAIKNRK